MEIIFECPDCEQFSRPPTTDEHEEFECPNCGQICNKVTPHEIPEEEHATNDGYAPRIANGLFEELERDRFEAKLKETEETNRFLLIAAKGGAYFIVGATLLSSKFHGFQSTAGASFSVIVVAGLISLFFMDLAERKQISVSKIFFWVWIVFLLSILIFKP